MKTVLQHELDQLLLRELQGKPNCSGASQVSTIRMTDPQWAANWQVDFLNPGTSDQNDCETALKEIQKRFVMEYTLAP